MQAGGICNGYIWKRTASKELAADKGYDSPLLRRCLRSRGIKPCIPKRQGQRLGRAEKSTLSVWLHF
jgi:hypothetical protein